jgi:uncharacterized protein (DUF433 family)
MSPTPTPYRYLAPNPESSYRQMFVKGTRIRAEDVYCTYSTCEPMTPEETAAQMNLPLEAVQEAIAYYESDPPELRADYAADEALMEATGMNDPNYKYHGKPKLLSLQEKARIIDAVYAAILGR